MKIIDLLNKIANGEEVPKKIKYNGIIYNLVYKNTIQGSYDYESSSNYLIGTLTEQKYLSDIVNVEVEIIEEDKEIEIPLQYIGIEENYIIINGNQKFSVDDGTQALALVINQLINEVSRLKNKE